LNKTTDFRDTYKDNKCIYNTQYALNFSCQTYTGIALTKVALGCICSSFIYKIPTDKIFQFYSSFGFYTIVFFQAILLYISEKIEKIQRRRLRDSELRNNINSNRERCLWLSLKALTYSFLMIQVIRRLYLDRSLQVRYSLWLYVIFIYIYVYMHVYICKYVYSLLMIQVIRRLYLDRSLHVKLFICWLYDIRICIYMYVYVCICIYIYVCVCECTYGHNFL
jgi:hypothetical protein